MQRRDAYFGSSLISHPLNWFSLLHLLIFWKDFFMLSSRRQVRFLKSSFTFATIAIYLIPSIHAQKSSDARDWPAYGGGPTSIHYSRLAQINRSNVKDLQVAWVFDTGDAAPGVHTELEATPIKIGDTLYLI